ncbi:hypothetical protein [Aquihabitans sp. G128]|uniref:hypothetical protein n=1 Tax=Aquihabitans sp. G128 TaxID=2849779 RepID=UPI0020B3BB32|nr:hypothetical protein [Aquihabitans sp. G128]
MQFIDLAAQQARIRAEVDAGIARVLDHGRYIMGPEVAEPRPPSPPSSATARWSRAPAGPTPW